MRKPQASPEWGDRITPDIVVALRGQELLPVAELDRGFVRPEYPAQVIVSYFQAGRICDYIQSRWGADKLLDMVHSFAQIEDHAGGDPAEPGHVARGIRQAVSGLARQDVGKTVANFDEWRNGLKRWPSSPRTRITTRCSRRAKRFASCIRITSTMPTPTNFWRKPIWPRATSRRPRRRAHRLRKAGRAQPGALKNWRRSKKELGEPKEAAATLDRHQLYLSGE